MSYLVTKMIKGNPYLYQVRSERRGDKVVQIFEKYIGRDNRTITQPIEDWEILRSNIYQRDKGICWICKELVSWDNYELGHLVDRCCGGRDDYDNLAVMHKLCNSKKPKHHTIEEHMKWLLQTSH
jgi:hypothetical protein